MGAADARAMEDVISTRTPTGAVYSIEGQQVAYISGTDFQGTAVVFRSGKQATTSAQPCLTAEEYPALARLWNNDDDTIFDTL